MNVYTTGSVLYSYILSLLLDQRFGLNPGVADKALASSDTGLANLAQLGGSPDRSTRGWSSPSWATTSTTTRSSATEDSCSC